MEPQRTTFSLAGAGSVLIGFTSACLVAGLLIGWAAGEVLGTIFFYQANLKSVYAITIGSFSFPGMYIAFSMIVLNLVLAIILTPIFNVIGLRRGRDITAPADYDVEEALPVEVGKEALG